MTRLPIYQVDAFTHQQFGGNPAAVVILKEWLPTSTMQQIAAENNLSETAFVVIDTPHCHIRWFSPSLEVNLCGHATLAAGFVILTKYFKTNILHLSSASGMLFVEKRSGGLYRLDFPAQIPQKLDLISPFSKNIALALQIDATNILSILQARETIVVLNQETLVKNLKPDFEKITRLDTFALSVTSQADAGTHQVDSNDSALTSSSPDFVNRFFFFLIGVPEDPVTGSSYCTLAPYWAQILCKNQLVAKQLSARGGRVFCEVAGDRVLISGHVVEYLQGFITISHNTP